MRLQELRTLLQPQPSDRIDSENRQALSESESEEVVVLLSQHDDAGTSQCPVCGERLPSGEEATAHVNRCLDGGAPAPRG